MATIQLPYFAEGISQSLPTNEAIEASHDILLDYPGRKVVRIGSDFVVKYGTGVDLIEGENMLFVSQVTTIPIPKVYAIYSNEETGLNYIVMENIHGQALDSYWSFLNETQKEAISRQLREFLDQLRKIPSPGYFGSIGRRGLQDSVFWTGKEIPPGLMEGPFETEDRLNEAMTQKYIYNNLPIQKASFYRRAFTTVLQNHRPIFTHGDFQRKNILIRTAPTAAASSESPLTNAKEDYSLVIIDWETSGWYPSYWEYALAMIACGRWDDDWHHWVDIILDPFLNEYAWMRTLRSELWS
ncbi:hypothetical protein B7494_g3493 [Chlorociboria aeruginascens]|nr:hypothetical protein B7494_g3493 [Chlorociboria aeruginascens]